MSQTIQRYSRRRRGRDWRDPFDWFTWYFNAEQATSTGTPLAILTDPDSLLLQTESGETIFTDP